MGVGSVWKLGEQAVAGVMASAHCHNICLNHVCCCLLLSFSWSKVSGCIKDPSPFHSLPSLKFDNRLLFWQFQLFNYWDCWVTLFDILVTGCDNIVIIFCLSWQCLFVYVCTYLAKRTNMALKHYRICRPINRINSIKPLDIDVTHS